MKFLQEIEAEFLDKLRCTATDEELASAIGHIWQGRSDRYSQLRSSMAPDTAPGKRRVEMSYIGG